MLLRVGLVSYVDKIFDERRIDLLVFGSNKHACDTQELIVLPFDLANLSVSIDHIYGLKKCFRQKLEFHVYIYQPVHQNPPHLDVDLLLVCETVLWGVQIFFESIFLHLELILGCILSDILKISDSLYIDRQYTRFLLIMSFSVIKFLDHILKSIDFLFVRHWLLDLI